MVTRSGLPQNYSSSSFEISDFQNISSWAVANGTKTADSYGMNIIPTAPGTTVTMDLNISFDGSLYNCIEYVVFCNDAVPSSTISSIRTYLFPQSGFSIGWSPTSMGGDCFRPGYNTIRVQAYPSPDGNPTHKNITHVRLSLYSKTGQSPNVSFVSMRIGNCTPTCQIQLDDCVSEVYSTIFPYLTALGIKGTLWAVPADIGTTGYMSLAQLHEMYSAGWAVANHTYSHVHLATLSYADQYSEILNGYNYLVANGFSRAADHLAFPWGEYNADTLAVCSDLGLKTARSTANYYQALLPLSVYIDPTNKYNTYSHHPTTYASFLGYFTNAVVRGSHYVMYHHDGGAGDGMSDGVLFSIYDEIARSKIACVTIDEWYNGLTNPRYRSLPVGRT